MPRPHMSSYVPRVPDAVAGSPRMIYTGVYSDIYRPTRVVPVIRTPFLAAGRTAAVGRSLTERGSRSCGHARRRRRCAPCWVAPHRLFAQKRPEGKGYMHAHVTEKLRAEKRRKRRGEEEKRRGEEEERRGGRGEKRREEEEKRRGRRQEEETRRREEERKKRRGEEEEEEEEKRRGRRKEDREEKAKEEEEEKKGKGTHPLHPFYTASHLVRGVPGPRKKRCRPSRGHPRHHWHCLGDLTPVLASYSDITGLFCSSRLRRTFLAPRLGLKSGTTSCRRARQRTQMNTAALTPPFRRFKKEGKGTTDGNRPTSKTKVEFFWPDTRDGDRTRWIFFRCAGQKLPAGFFSLRDADLRGAG